MAKKLCNATGCDMEVRGCDIPHHYKTKTDWKLLEQLKLMSSDVAEEESKKADGHTLYMFKNNHSAANLPKWITHRPVKRAIPAMFQPKPARTDSNENMEDGGGENNDVNETGESLPRKRREESETETETVEDVVVFNEENDSSVLSL